MAVFQFVCAMVVLTLASGSGERCRRIGGLDFEPPPVRAYASTPPPGQRAFAAFGYTQRTSWQECVIGREVNDAETRGLLQAVAEAGR